MSSVSSLTWLRKRKRIDSGEQRAKRSFKARRSSWRIERTRNTAPSRSSRSLENSVVIGSNSSKVIAAPASAAYRLQYQVSEKSFMSRGDALERMKINHEETEGSKKNRKFLLAFGVDFWRSRSPLVEAPWKE